MSSIEIRRVENKKDLTRFIDFHYDLYKGSPYDAPNLFSDDFNTLSKNSNAAFEFCDAEYFLAYKDNRIAGRVAAIINHKANKQWNRRSVRFGWLDFIDDYDVSEALLKAVADYGRANGMNEIVGPLGFTDMDPEGMLTFGFDQLGTMATSYNYEYYPKHMEHMGGWLKDNDYVEYKLMVPEKIPEKYTRVATVVTSRYNLRVHKLKRNEIFGPDGYGEKVFKVINATFANLYGYSQLTDRQIAQYVKMYLPMADLNLVTLIEDWNKPGHPVVGVGITIPSLTRALQKCRRGRLLPFGWWHVLRALKFHHTKVVDLLLVGVLPEYRSKGANSLLFYDLIPWYQKYGFLWAETHVEMETNSKVQSQWGPLNPINHKRRRCYKKSL